MPWKSRVKQSEETSSGKVGLFGIFLGIFGPFALFARLIRRGTKAGTVKITLSMTQTSTHMTERYVVVELPEMATSKEQVNGAG